MFFNLLNTWLRGLLAVAVIVAGIVFAKQWTDELPRHRLAATPSGAVVEQPLGVSERLRAWKPRADRATAWLAGAIALLALSVGGRALGPRARRPRRGEAAPAERTMRVPTRHGHALELASVGSAADPVIVLVHGLGSDRTQWRELVAPLARRFRVVTYDLAGHGRSRDVDGATCTVAAAAEDLDDVLRHTGGGDVVLAGHSMGGQVALAWCLAHPEHAGRIGALVLAHTTPQNPFTTMRPLPLNRALDRPVHRAVLALTTAVPWLVELLNRLAYLDGTVDVQVARELFHGGESREQLERMARLQATIDAGAVARFARSMRGFDARAALSAIHVPTLVVAGDGDRTTIPEAGRVLADGIPGARLHVLEHARHLGCVEHAAEFATLVTRFHDEVHAARPAAG